MDKFAINLPLKEFDTKDPLSRTTGTGQLEFTRQASIAQIDKTRKKSRSQRTIIAESRAIEEEAPVESHAADQREEDGCDEPSSEEMAATLAVKDAPVNCEDPVESAATEIC